MEEEVRKEDEEGMGEDKNGMGEEEELTLWICYQTTDYIQMQWKSRNCGSAKSN